MLSISLLIIQLSLHWNRSFPVANDQDIPLFVGELDSVNAGGFAAYGFSYYDIGYEAGQKRLKSWRMVKNLEISRFNIHKNWNWSSYEKAAKDMGVEIKEEWKADAEFVK